MSSDSIYYYTSNTVFAYWLINQKIWATKSTTSNDDKDTVYVIKHLDELSKTSDDNTKIYIEAIINTIKISKKISRRLYNTIIFEYIKETEFNKFGDVVKTALWQYNDALKVKKPNQESIENLKNIGIYPNEKGEINTRGAEHEEILFRDILINLFNTNKISKYFQDCNYIDEILLRCLPDLLQPFVICFTNKPDNRFLWDSYTKNGGVCMEFCKSDIKEHFEPRTIFFNYDLFEDIIYKDTNQLAKLKQIINDNGQNNPEIISIISALFKHPYWEDESETRAVFTAKYFSDKRYEIKENLNLKYSNGLLTQDYIEVDVPISLLKSITIGPMNTEEALISEITEILKKENLYEDCKAKKLIRTIEIKKSIGTGVIKK